MPDILITAFDRSFLSSIASVSDAFSMANMFVRKNFQKFDHDLASMNIRIVSVSGEPRISTLCGREIITEGSWRDIDRCRVIFLPAFFIAHQNDVLLLGRAHRDFADWLADQARHGAIIAGTGAAVPLMAQAGLLDNGRAAVHETLRPMFRRQHRDINIDDSLPVVRSGRIFTALSAGNDGELAIELVKESMSPSVAGWSNYRLHFQSDREGHGPPELADTHDPVVQGVCRFLWENFSERIDFAALAMQLAVSERTLVRRFEHALKCTPHQYLQRTRVEASKRLLARTTVTIERTAAMTGYSDVRHFRSLFRQFTGMSPSRYRRDNRIDH